MHDPLVARAHIMICGVRMFVLISLCGSTIPPLTYTSSAICSTGPRGLSRRREPRSRRGEMRACPGVPQPWLPRLHVLPEHTTILQPGPAPNLAVPADDGPRNARMLLDLAFPTRGGGGVCAEKALPSAGADACRSQPGGSLAYWLLTAGGPAPGRLGARCTSRFARRPRRCSLGRATHLARFCSLPQSWPSGRPTHFPQIGRRSPAARGGERAASAGRGSVHCGSARVGVGVGDSTRRGGAPERQSGSSGVGLSARLGNGQRRRRGGRSGHSPLA